ncbi:uncharacterized protein LOC144128166 [Amblyomma americanum]
MLQEDTAPRCSSPNWDDLSATFEDNPHDSTYQPSLDTSAVSSSEPSPPLKFIVYENCLLQLANLYRKCHHPAQSSLKDAAQHRACDSWRMPAYAASQSAHTTESKRTPYSQLCIRFRSWRRPAGIS